MEGCSLGAKLRLSRITILGTKRNDPRMGTNRTGFRFFPRRLPTQGNKNWDENLGEIGSLVS